MKTALYIEDGVVQIVLTPEKDAEKGILAILQGELQATAYRGSFYSCQGGWVRQRDLPRQASAFGCSTIAEESRLRDESLIVVVKDVKPEHVKEVA